MAYAPLLVNLVPEALQLITLRILAGKPAYSLARRCRTSFFAKLAAVTSHSFSVCPTALLDYIRNNPSQAQPAAAPVGRACLMIPGRRTHPRQYNSRFTNYIVGSMHAYTHQP